VYITDVILYCRSSFNLSYRKCKLWNRDGLPLSVLHVYTRYLPFTEKNGWFDVHGSVHHSTIHKEKNPTRCNNVSNFYYSIFIWSSTCFGRHTAHHQEPKTALAVSSFSYVKGCWTCGRWTLSGTVCLTTSTIYTSKNLSRMKNQRLPVQFRLLMTDGVSPETCWASYRYRIIKFWYIVASCLIFSS